MFEWPLDKLDIINSALSQTGDNAVAALNDGSEEWNCASPAYERALAYMIEQHPWRWTTTGTMVEPATNLPANENWDTAYNLPPDLVHLIWMLIDGRPAVYDLEMGPPQANGTPGPVQLVTNSQGGPPRPIPPQKPLPVRIKYVSQAASDPSYGTPTFVLALITYTMSGIYRGLHEDTAEADKVWAGAEGIMSKAKTRHDQQTGKRAPYNSRMTASRRLRRPYPPVPGGWSGTGIPG